MGNTRSKSVVGLSRRAVLAGGAGALLLGFRIPHAAASGDELAPNAFIRIGSDDRITLIMPQVEMGQGTYTSIPMIIAEELDADLAKVVLEHAPPNEKLYANPMLGVQATGNSNSVRAFWKPLRMAGATTRAMLVAAAAQQWGVDASACTTANSVVTHPASSRRLSYGALAGSAAQLTPPLEAPLKDPAKFTLIGQPLKRLDTPEKVNGKAVYGIDVMPAGVKFAALAISPVLGGKVAHADNDKARAVPGVRQVVVLDDLVAVVADHQWAANRGLAALGVTWDDGANGDVDSARIWDELRKSSATEGLVAKKEGDAEKTLADGDRMDQFYELPMLAHATMEPLNCTAHVTAEGCEVWIGTQIMARVQTSVAAALGLPPEKVKVNQHLLGGGFGRKLEPDMAVNAARIAQHVDSPVKVVYSREEDIQHDVYRPAYRDLISATLKDGRIAAWKHRIAGSSVVARWLPAAFKDGYDFDAVDSAVDMPYDIPNKLVEYVRCEPPGVVTGFWRGVGPNNNIFAIETFMDEMAHKAGKDPVDFRVAMLDGTPRLKAVVQQAAKLSGWGEALPARTGRGIAAQISFASFIATVCEAEVDTDGEVLLRRVVSVVDTGIAVNPDTVAAQLQGGLVFGLTAGFYGEITLAKGRVQQSNFHDYRMLRINQVPNIEVHVVKSGEAPGGIGETGANGSLPSLGNALFAATGIRLRRMPVDRDVLAGRKPA
jgi:isoquinoline 1-oxidoreductase subunit beta